jgi:AcrR family transcriptional regulator
VIQLARQPNLQLRADIINTAIEIMHKEGFDALSMRKVAKQNSIVVGNVYRYFENKEALLLEIFNPLREQMGDFLQLRFDQIIETYPTVKDLQKFMVTESAVFAKKLEHTLELHYKELQIIIKEPRISEQIRHDITEIIKSLLNAYAKSQFETYEQMGKYLVSMFAKSIMHGMFDAIHSYPANKTKFKTIVQSYFVVFSKLLETDILDLDFK